MMRIDQKIQFIKQRLVELTLLDKSFAVFGSNKHKYQLNPCKTERGIKSFEDEYKICLPEGYRQFLLEIGNGGVGPYYGLQPLEDSLFSDLDFKQDDDLLNPTRPFLMTESWNMIFDGDIAKNFEAFKAFENTYFENRWVDGLLRICNYGCGVSMNLVVNGDEYGHIWVDDRGNDGGIYPDPFFGQSGRTLFLDWYILWLNQSLIKIGS
ncbi:MAG: SMI1/KNR4 family protein [Chloroflexota bacterium]